MHLCLLFTCSGSEKSSSSPLNREYQKKKVLGKEKPETFHQHMVIFIAWLWTDPLFIMEAALDIIWR